MLAEYHRVDPDEEVERAERGDEDQPEPDEDEDFLVEQIDGQHTLDGVVVHVLKLTDLEEAMRDSRELWTLRPALASRKVINHLKAVHVKVRAEKFVEDKELPNGVAQVEEFDEHVEGDQVVAVTFAPHDAAILGDLLAETDEAARAVLPGVLYPPVHVAHDVFDGAVPVVRRHVCCLGSQGDNLVQVHAGRRCEDPP